MRAGAALLLAAACGDAATAPAPAAPKPVLTAVATASPRCAEQLVSGFYQIESGWRWTGARFQVRLMPPPESAWRGVRVYLDGLYPESLARHHSEATVRCDLDGVALAPETLRRVGDFHFSREVPPAPVRPMLLSCQVSPTLPPNGAETRELGVVLIAAGLRPR